MSLLYHNITTIEEGLLIRELVEKDGLNQTEVATLLDRHKSFVNRRLAIIRDLSPQVIEDIKLGLLPGGSALSLAHASRCRTTTRPNGTGLFRLTA